MRFARWLIDDSVSLSVYTADSCGVYVLEFADGEEYVGQTTHLLRRFADHRRRWPGEIVAVQFCKVRPAELDDLERDIVEHRLRDGARLRNIDLIGLPIRSNVLDRFVEPVDIEDWLAGDIDASNIGDRGVAALQRQRTRPKFEELAARPDYLDIREALAFYLVMCVPFPHRTERKIWVISTLPTTNKGRGYRRLCAVTINNVEAFVIDEFHMDDGAASIGGFVNLAPITWRPEEADGYLDFRDAEYGKTGPVTSMEFSGLDAFLDAFRQPEVERAARKFAVGLLRKGSGMFAKHHDFNLADEIFASIEQWLDEEPGDAVDTAET